MNIKEYIDQFKEISERERSQQFEILEQARDEAEAHLHLKAFEVLKIGISPLAILAVAAPIYLGWGFTSWLPIVALILGLLISRIVAKEIETLLIKKALQRVLARQTLK